MGGACITPAAASCSACGQSGTRRAPVPPASGQTPAFGRVLRVDAKAAHVSDEGNVWSVGARCAAGNWQLPHPTRHPLLGHLPPSTHLLQTHCPNFLWAGSGLRLLGTLARPLSALGLLALVALGRLLLDRLRLSSSSGPADEHSRHAGRPTAMHGHVAVSAAFDELSVLGHDARHRNSNWLCRDLEACGCTRGTRTRCRLGQSSAAARRRIDASSRS